MVTAATPTKRTRTRDALLVALQELLLDPAAEAVSVPRVVGRCGVAQGTFYNYFDSLPDAIDAVSGELVTTHVHDNRGRWDDHLVPFDGRIDWATALMSMQKAGYEGALIFELASAARPGESLEKASAARQRFEAILGADSEVLTPES